MKGWIAIDSLPEANWKHETVHGVEIEVALSPYDVPQAVRGYMAGDSQWFVIEFRYLTDERTSEKQVSETLIVTHGLHSQRIYAVKINVKALKTKAVGLKIKRGTQPGVTCFSESVAETIDKFSSLQPSRSSEKYELNKAVVKTRDRELFRDVPVC